MDDYKKFIQRLGLVGLTNFIVALSSIVLLVILTKNLNIDDYGIWVQFLTTIGLITAIGTLGLPFSLVRFLASSKDNQYISEVFYSIFLLTFICSVITSITVFIFSKEIANTLFGGLILVVQILSLAVLFSCLNGYIINYFRALQQIKIYSVITCSKTILSVLLIVFVLYCHWGLFGISFAYTINEVIAFVLTLFIIIREIGIKVPTMKNIREYISFGLPTLPGNLSYWVVDSSDRYIIVLFLGMAFVGYYSPSYALGNVIQMLFVPFFFLLPPLLSNYYDNDKINELKNFLSLSLKYSFIFVVPAVIFLSILSKPLLILLTTTTIAINGYLVTPIIALSAFLGGIQGIISQTFVLFKKTKILAYIWILTALLNLILNFLFVPYLGIIGAAIMTLLAYLVALIITFYYSNKLMKFSYQSVTLLKTLIISIFVSLILIMFYPVELYQIVLGVMFCLGLYFIMLVILRVINLKELEIFYDALKI